MGLDLFRGGSFLRMTNHLLCVFKSFFDPAHFRKLCRLLVAKEEVQDKIKIVGNHPQKPFRLNVWAHPPVVAPPDASST